MIRYLLINHLVPVVGSETQHQVDEHIITVTWRWVNFRQTWTQRLVFAVDQCRFIGWTEGHQLDHL